MPFTARQSESSSRFFVSDFPFHLSKLTLSDRPSPDRIVNPFLRRPFYPGYTYLRFAFFTLTARLALSFLFAALQPVVSERGFSTEVSVASMFRRAFFLVPFTLLLPFLNRWLSSICVQEFVRLTFLKIGITAW